MGFANRAIVAAGLGFAVSALVGCGSSAGGSLLSAQQANQLSGQLQQARDALRDHDCNAASNAISDFQSSVDSMGSVNQTLVSNLNQGAQEISNLISEQCQTPVITPPHTTRTTATNPKTTTTATVTTNTDTTPTNTYSYTQPTNAYTTPTDTYTQPDTTTTTSTTGGSGFGTTTTTQTTTTTDTTTTPPTGGQNPGGGYYQGYIRGGHRPRAGGYYGQ